MDKSFLVFIVIGIGFLYVITHFIGDIQEEDDKYQNKDYVQEHRYDKYQKVDSVGRNILNLLGTDAGTQVAAWNETGLKEEYMALFPDFGGMKNFVKERIKGDALSAKLLKKTSAVEDKFFSGSITAEEAKQELSVLK